MARTTANSWRPQFSLRTLLLAALLAGPLVGWIGSRLRSLYTVRGIIPRPMSDFGGFGLPSHSRHSAVAGDWPNEGQPSANWNAADIEGNSP